MAKRNMIEREKRRAALVAKFAARREKLRQILKDPNASYEDKQAASVAMQKLPRDASYIRQRKRCTLTGRPRGVYRKFGLARTKLREATMKGEVPGLKMASW